MEIRTLSKDDLKIIYESNYIFDFPKRERKTLSELFNAVDKGVYECYGAYENGLLEAYAFFICCKNDRLLDYFAAVKELRGKGIGSEMLKKLTERFGSGVFIAEVEDPDFAHTDDERSIRERRISFYSRCGFSDTGLRPFAYGTEFRLIRYSDGNAAANEEIKEIYKSAYRSVLSEKEFARTVKI